MMLTLLIEVYMPRLSAPKRISYNGNLVTKF